MSVRDPWPHGRARESAPDLLDAARRALRHVPRFGPEREHELVESILARTTRSPRSTGRSRAWWLSIAAAALVASAGALTLASRGRRTSTPAELGPEVELAALAPAERAEVAQKAPLASARDELAATAAAGSRTRMAVDLGADAPLELRLLEARARGLRERRWDPWLREVALPELGTLALALWCEVELDRYVLCGSRPPAWNQAVAILERDLARAENPREGSKLLGHALERARGYGLTEGVAVARVEHDAPLWSGQWFDDLDAAGREAGIAENGVWRAWVDWRGR